MRSSQRGWEERGEEEHACSSRLGLFTTTHERQQQRRSTQVNLIKRTETPAQQRRWLLFLLLCFFSHSAYWLPTEKLLYTVTNPAPRGLLNRENR